MSASELSASASMRNDFSAFSYYRSQCVSASGITEDTPADAVELDGAEVIGYLGWGLIDIPSSSGDIEKRYGAVYVDYDAASGERLKRIPKKSFTWFKRAYESNGEDLG
ncbi:family 1 glycosylhydrolase [Enorma phocaeensis]|nr:family 1 glycosylhydrolase [Enorma phocaeensis]